MIDVLADIAFAIWDGVELAKDPTDPWKWAAVGADIAFAFISGATGGGVAVRGIAKGVNTIDNASDAAKGIAKEPTRLTASPTRRRLPRTRTTTPRPSVCRGTLRGRDGR